MSVSTMQPQPPSVVAAPASKLRLWPGIVLVAILWLVRAWVSSGEGSPFKFFFGLVIAPLAVVAGLLLWWLFASRLRWSERLIGVVALAVVSVGTALIAGNNFPFMALILYALPVLMTGWVVWLLVSSPLSWPIRRNGLILFFVATGAFFSCLRVDGMDGSFAAKFNWRWTPTPEQVLLSDLKSTNAAPTSNDAVSTTDAAELAEQPGDWPGFRGPQRDSRLTGVQIETNWEQSPPKLVWKHRVGPGWSSFAVIGDRLFTQEQRGEEECVVCYDAGTGNEVWSHRDNTRFTELVAGAGPRGTPEFHDGKIYALGANGKLNCLNAATGKSIWVRDLVQDVDAKIPQWGFSSSPLVAHGLVTVFAGAPEKKSVLAYQADTGDLAWSAGEGALSYCSTQNVTIDGVEQLLIATDAGLSSFVPETGELLWSHPWPSDGVARVVQPARATASDLLIGTGMGVGTRRVSITRDGDKWQTSEQWTTRDIRPYYNDLVIQDEHLYGFDNNLLTCVRLKDGKRTWRARGYGNGQVLLLVDQGLLLVLTETGEVALVAAEPDKHHELTRFQAIEGKTWNHPVVAHGRLFVRNAEEAACFQLTLVENAEQHQAAAVRGEE